MLTGAAVALTARRASAAGTPVRMALLPIDTDSCLFYANDQGFFTEAGIDAQIQIIQAGSAVIAAILGGSIDVGFTNPISLAAAHLRGIPIVAIAPGGVYDSRSPATAAIVVPKSSKLKSARDFNGTTMACSGLKTLGQWGPAAWLDRNGGDSKQVQFTEMPFPDMPLALANGRVDSAFPAEPFITESSAAARVFADAFAAVAPRFSLGIWVTTTQWADAHRDVVARFAQAIAKAAAWGNTHHEQSSEILTKYLKLDATVAKGMRRVRYAERLSAAEMQPVIDLAVRYGTLPSPPVAAGQLLYTLGASS